jgi:hypothetical protein
MEAGREDAQTVTAPIRGRRERPHSTPLPETGKRRELPTCHTIPELGQIPAARLRGGVNPAAGAPKPARRNAGPERAEDRAWYQCAELTNPPSHQSTANLAPELPESHTHESTDSPTSPSAVHEKGRQVPAPQLENRTNPNTATTRLAYTTQAPNTGRTARDQNVGARTAR